MIKEWRVKCCGEEHRILWNEKAWAFPDHSQLDDVAAVLGRGPNVCSNVLRCIRGEDWDFNILDFIPPDLAGVMSRCRYQAIRVRKERQARRMIEDRSPLARAARILNVRARRAGVDCIITVANGRVIAVVFSGPIEHVSSRVHCLSWREAVRAARHPSSLLEGRCGSAAMTRKGGE